MRKILNCPCNQKNDLDFMHPLCFFSLSTLLTIVLGIRYSQYFVESHHWKIVLHRSLNETVPDSTVSFCQEAEMIWSKTVVLQRNVATWPRKN